MAGGIVFFLGGVRSISQWTEEYITLLLDVSYASFSSEKALWPAGIARVLHRAESTLHMQAHYIRNKCMLCFISQFLNIVISLASSERGPPIYATSHGVPGLETMRYYDGLRLRRAVPWTWTVAGDTRLSCVGTRELLTNAEIDGISGIGLECSCRYQIWRLIGVIGIESRAARLGVCELNFDDAAGGSGVMHMASSGFSVDFLGSDRRMLLCLWASEELGCCGSGGSPRHGQ